MKLALVGATGMVGEIMLKVLAERNFPIDELLLVASERYVGKEISFKGTSHKIIALKEASDAKPDIDNFAASGSTSLEWSQKFAEVESTVIDNSTALRMEPDKKLIVPDINEHLLTKDYKIIANPNCSTIQ